MEYKRADISLKSICEINCSFYSFIDNLNLNNIGEPNEKGCHEQQQQQ